MNTGFSDPNVHDMILVGSVDFGEVKDMYISLKESTDERESSLYQIQLIMIILNIKGLN